MSNWYKKANDQMLVEKIMDLFLRASKGEIVSSEIENILRSNYDAFTLVESVNEAYKRVMNNLGWQEDYPSVEIQKVLDEFENMIAGEDRFQLEMDLNNEKHEGLQ